MPSLVELRHLSVEVPARDSSAAALTRAGRAGGGPALSPRLFAVSDVGFTMAPGEVLGLVGESGSGKSLASLAIMRLLPPGLRVSGEIWFNEVGPARNLLALPEEEMRSLRGRQIAMIFQEPMTALNPVMRVGRQIAEAACVHSRISKQEAWDRAVQAMQDVAIPDPARRARDYPHQLSGGMRQRVMIAMAIVNRPQLLIADEPTTALDVTVQAQILALLADLRDKFGLAMLLISHDLAVVSQVADRVAVMYVGRLLELGSKQHIFRAPAHPYTRGLLQAVPTFASDRTQPLRTIEGSVPPLGVELPGCPFEARCHLRIPQCARDLPRLVEVAPGHWARCPVVNP
ncbi:MAG TPA: ABC transporter ATP-binding protein [Terriglobales bacterium]|nr:ABC transporter ATP-binding protein [Terriglobales bacterium]